MKLRPNAAGGGGLGMRRGWFSRRGDRRGGFRGGFASGGFRSAGIGSGFRGGGFRAAAIGPGFRSAGFAGVVSASVVQLSAGTFASPASVAVVGTGAEVGAGAFHSQD